MKITVAEYRKLCWSDPPVGRINIAFTQHVYLSIGTTCYLCQGLLYGEIKPQM
jgi:hypothetical protein